jgi:hypothetical protein
VQDILDHRLPQGPEFLPNSLQTIPTTLPKLILRGHLAPLDKLLSLESFIQLQPMETHALLRPSLKALLSRTIHQYQFRAQLLLAIFLMGIQNRKFHSIRIILYKFHQGIHPREENCRGLGLQVKKNETKT